MAQPPPRSPLFPYTTLFRSDAAEELGGKVVKSDARLLLERLRVGQQTRIRFQDRKSTRLNSSHRCISYAVFCLKKKRLRSAQNQLPYTSSSLQPDRFYDSCR